MTEPTSPSDVQERGVGDEVEDVAVKKAQNLINAILESHEPRCSKVSDDGRIAHTVGELASIYASASSDVVGRMVEQALQMLGCQQDQASRINSVKFFTSSFMFRAILDSFDSKDGLQKFLNILQSVGSVRSLEKQNQMAYHICVALRQYFRAHLLLLIDILNGGAPSGSGNLDANKTLDISNEAIDEVFVHIRTDGELARKLVWASWPVVQQFLEFNGHITLLELYQAPTMEGYLPDMAQYIFGILHIVTFVQCTRESIFTAQLSNNRVGMAVILDAANPVGNYDYEVIRPALNVLINLVCPAPPPISKKPLTIPSGSNAAPTSAVVKPLRFSPHLPSIRKRHLTISSGSNIAPTPTLVKRSRLTCDFMLKRGRRLACEKVRDNNGINVLLNLLNSSVNMPPGMVESIRALTCRVLLGLAIDDKIADILTRLQVEMQLSKLISDSTGQPLGVDQGRWKNEFTDVTNELITTLANYQKTAPFPFLALPIHIQESILSRVPVIYLIRLLSVSKDFRTLLSPTFPLPPPDVFFLLFSHSLGKASCLNGSAKLLSFHPSSSRWIELPIPSDSPLCHSSLLATSSSLAVTEFPLAETPLMAVRMFSRLPPQTIPPMISIGSSSVLAVIPDADVVLPGQSDDFKIVASCYRKYHMLCSQTKGVGPAWYNKVLFRTTTQHKAVVLNNSLYMRSCEPDQLLQFDLTSGTWNFILPMPECLCTHIFSYNQNIYLVAGQGNKDWGILSIRVFMLDWSENHESPKWREISVLSERDETFVKFRSSFYTRIKGFSVLCFDAVDRNGLVCLFNTDSKAILLFDVRNRSWVLVPPSPMAPNYPCWYGHATEMGLEVLRPVGAK